MTENSYKKSPTRDLRSKSILEKKFFNNTQFALVQKRQINQKLLKRKINPKPKKNTNLSFVKAFAKKKKKIPKNIFFEMNTLTKERDSKENYYFIKSNILKQRNPVHRRATSSFLNLSGNKSRSNSALKSARNKSNQKFSPFAKEYNKSGKATNNSLKRLIFSNLEKEIIKRSEIRITQAESLLKKLSSTSNYKKKISEFLRNSSQFSKSSYVIESKENKNLLLNKKFKNYEEKNYWDIMKKNINTLKLGISMGPRISPSS